MAPPKAKKPKRPVKVQVPRLSVVRPPQADLDVASLRLQGKPLSARLGRTITAMTVQQTIEGASTLTLTVADWGGDLLRSKLLTGKVTLTFDGLSWTLVKISAGDRAITLTFEETAVNLLRQYDSPKKANRANTTRAQFVRSLITEVKEARIPYRIPEVNVRQPISGSKP